MDDIDIDDHVEDDTFDDTSYRACYIFRSAKSHREHGAKERPSKKRKLNGSVPSKQDTIRISENFDNDYLARKRQELFHDFWRNKQELLQNNVDASTVESLADFILSNTSGNAQNGLRTALLLTGFHEDTYRAVTDLLADHLGASRPNIIASISSGQCTSLQNALKHIIKSTVSKAAGDQAYHTLVTKHKRIVPLNYDLELLERFAEENELSGIVVSLVDVESFDSQVVNELITTLHLWRIRIPFTLMLGITSTQELFEYRLSKSSLKLLQTRAFNLSPDINEDAKILRDFQLQNEAQARLLLGPSTISAMNEITKAQGKSLSLIGSGLKFTSMSHFLANPLSIVSAGAESHLDLLEKAPLASTIRASRSFRSYCERMISRESLFEKRTNDVKAQASKVRDLLEDDDALFKTCEEEIRKGQETYSASAGLIGMLADLHFMLTKDQPQKRRPKLEIEAQFYHNLQDLTDCDIFDEIESLIRSAAHTTLVHISEKLAEAGTVFSSLSLLSRIRATNGMSVNGITKSNLPETPKKAGKKSATGTPASGTGAANNSVDDFVTELRQLSKSASLDMSTLLLHEAYILSTRSIHFKPNFEPNPRNAVERALLRPGDYLGCDCCGGLENQSESSKGPMPAASILFTLLQEAPTVVNVRDLFDAFQSRLETRTTRNGVDADGDESDLKGGMAQFYRALAELKMFGLVKSSTATQIKKRGAGKNAKATSQDVDFVAKTSWAGL